jgi:hypothetical protein
MECWIPLYHCFVKQFNMKFMVCISVKYIIFIIEYYCLEKTLVFVIIYVDTLRLYIIVMLYI